MKAALIDRYGSNDAVSVADIEIPTVGATDLLVRVHAASVNPVDIRTREGKLKTLLNYRFPLVLGNDLSGVVSDVGSGVTRFKKGDAIYARVDKDRIGTFAEFAVVRDGAAALKPTTVGKRNVELVKRLGADVAIDYRTERFEDVATDCDVELDSAGIVFVAHHRDDLVGVPLRVLETLEHQQHRRVAGRCVSVTTKRRRYSHDDRNDDRIDPSLA